MAIGAAPATLIEGDASAADALEVDVHGRWAAGEVVFVFEGHRVEWMVDDLIDDPFQPELQSALDGWRSIADDSPRIASERFGWEAQEAVSSAADAMAGGAR